MAELDRIIDNLKSMSLADLSILQSELGGIMRVQALNELESKERELNDLRVLAGFKRKPFKSQKPSTPPAADGTVKRRGRRSNAEIAAEKVAKEAEEKAAADTLAANKAEADAFDNAAGNKPKKKDAAKVEPASAE